jgi:hypothetical protein
MLCIPQVLRGISLCPGICVSDKSTSNFETQNEATAHPENWPVKHSKPSKRAKRKRKLARTPVYSNYPVFHEARWAKYK